MRRAAHPERAAIEDKAVAVHDHVLQSNTRTKGKTP